MRYPVLSLVVSVAGAVLAPSINAQTQPASEAPTTSAALADSGQPPDFVSMFVFQGGYKNVVSLNTNTTDGVRIFRMEGERCFVEGKFSASDGLGGQATAWILPAITYARSASDAKFCEAGARVPVILQKAIKKSFLGSFYRSGEFKWGGFSGSFEVK